MQVIKTGGAVVARPNAARAIANAWHNRTEDWTLVHGGGPQLDQALQAVQGNPEKINGLRVTHRSGADAVRRTMSLIGADLTAALQAVGVPAVHIPPEKGALLAVTKKVPDGDVGRVGTVTALRTGLVHDLLEQGKLPVLTPVGWDADGPLNVNADEGASVAAIHLHATSLVLATDVPAVLDAKGEPIDAMNAAEAQQLMDDGTAEGGMHAKLDQAIEALEAGIPEVRIGPVEAALDEDVGTQIHPTKSVLVSTA